MVHHISRLRYLCTLLVVCLSQASCTELGDLVVIPFQISKGSPQLKHFDREYLPKEDFGKAEKCLARRSRVELGQYTGVCYDDGDHVVVVYSTFPLKYRAREIGVSEALMESDTYRELSALANGVEAQLKNDQIRYSKSKPHFEDFRTLNTKYKFFR